MTATLAGSTAVLKYLYPKGELPKEVHKQFRTLDRLKKATDFVGDSEFVALQNENPQGSAGTFADATTSLKQGTYNRFQLTRVEHFGIARVKGQAAEAAVKNEGALVDLWQNETQGIAMTELECLAVYLFGNGDGTLAQGSSGSATNTVTLATSANMNYFALGQRLTAVSTTGLTPTFRSGSSVVTSIDRKNRTLTNTGSAWNVQIGGLVDADYYCRAGDQVGAVSSGTATVITGLLGYVAGGSSPSSLFGLTRSTDPVRLAGQTQDFTGIAMEDAVVEASALVGFQAIGYPDVLVANNRDIANMKKSLAGKILYDRNNSSKAGVSFSSLVIEGEAGPIEVIADPFCPRNTAYLLKWDAFDLHSLNAAPHLQNYDSNNFLRVSTDDAFEVRFVTYGNLRCKLPGVNFRLTGFGQ